MKLTKTEQRTKGYLMQCAKGPLADTIMDLNNRNAEMLQALKDIKNALTDSPHYFEESMLIVAIELVINPIKK